jgi:hypothetical protein
VPEPVDQWWARRQRSKGADVPYPVGTYRSDWERYPVLIRQYHPEFNHGVTLTQVPPAADVYLVWQCDVGHLFVATPWEQRMRPDGSRRRSTWCPVCAEEATGRERRRIVAAVDARRDGVVARLDGADARRYGSGARRDGSGAPRRRSSGMPVVASAAADRDTLAADQVGDAFVSARAPRPASAAEPELRRRLAERLDLDLGCNAVRVAQPFHGRLEVWPDIVLRDLRVAIEYDTTGRDGLEHVGRREQSDRRKDRLLRHAGWEVVRVRGGRLQPLGPYDVSASTISDRLVDRVIDRLREIRGELIVNAYLNASAPSGWPRAERPAESGHGACGTRAENGGANVERGGGEEAGGHQERQPSVVRDHRAHAEQERDADDDERPRRFPKAEVQLPGCREEPHRDGDHSDGDEHVQPKHDAVDDARASRVAGGCADQVRAHSE